MLRISLFFAQVLILVGLFMHSSVATAGLSCRDIFSERTMNGGDASVLIHLMRFSGYSFKKDPFENTWTPQRMQLEFPGFIHDLPVLPGEQKFQSIVYLDMPNAAKLKAGDTVELKWVLPAYPADSQTLVLRKQILLDEVQGGKAGFMRMTLATINGTSGRDLRDLELHFLAEDAHIAYLPGTKFRVSFSKDGELDVLELTEVTN